MGELKGKTAIVTGASRGIGGALGVALAKEGMDLVLAARGRAVLEETAAGLSRKYKVRVVPVACDVTRQDDLENLAATAVREFKKIDALINSAGVSSQYPFQEQPLEDISRLMYTNYFGAVMLTRLMINHFIENKSGAVINITSGSTLVDPPPRTFIVYSSLKRALNAFSKGLFWELRDLGIKVTSIMPGVTDTALTGGLAEISVINQRTPWTSPVIPYRQDHPKE